MGNKIAIKQYLSLSYGYSLLTNYLARNIKILFLISNVNA